ncbi:MAG: hypothetical protein ABI036_08350, partial [Fibrobacteria bacterium]
FRCHMPRGAYYVMADVADFIRSPGRKSAGLFKDDAELARHLVSEVKVATVPGSSFYKIKGKAATAHKLRFCFCKKEETLALALERLRAFREA